LGPERQSELDPHLRAAAVQVQVGLQAGQKTSPIGGPLRRECGRCWGAQGRGAHGRGPLPLSRHAPDAHLGIPFVVLPTPHPPPSPPAKPSPALAPKTSLQKFANGRIAASIPSAATMVSPNALPESANTSGSTPAISAADMAS